MSSQAIVFGQNPNQVRHTFRYTDGLGLDRVMIMETILADIYPSLPLPVPAPDNSPLIGTVWVNGIELRYHAFPVSGELVNVGSIRPLL
jgi:hypothetical protein